MDDLRHKSMQAATRQAKARRVKAFQGPSYPTQRQYNYLGGLIGTFSRAEIDGFARFANCYDHGHLTKLHFIHAIQLAAEGRNIYGSSEELVRMSYDPDFIPDADPGEFQRRMIARKKAKGAKRPERGNAAQMAPTMKDIEDAKKARTSELVASLNRERAERFRKG